MLCHGRFKTFSATLFTQGFKWAGTCENGVPFPDIYAIWRYGALKSAFSMETHVLRPER